MRSGALLWRKVCAVYVSCIWCAVGESVCATAHLLFALPCRVAAEYATPAVRPPKGNPKCICLPSVCKEIYGGPRKTKPTMGFWTVGHTIEATLCERFGAHGSLYSIWKNSFSADKPQNPGPLSLCLKTIATHALTENLSRTNAATPHQHKEKDSRQDRDCNTHKPQTTNQTPNPVPTDTESSSGNGLSRSTSVIHNRASVRSPEQEHTSILKLVFQHWNVEDIGKLFENACPRPDSSVVQLWIFTLSSFCMRGRIPSWKVSAVSVWQRFWGFLFRFINFRSRSLCVQVRNV